MNAPAEAPAPTPEAPSVRRVTNWFMFAFAVIVMALGTVASLAVVIVPRYERMALAERKAGRSLPLLDGLLAATWEVTQEWWLLAALVAGGAAWVHWYMYTKYVSRL